MKSLVADTVSRAMVIALTFAVTVGVSVPSGGWHCLDGTPCPPGCTMRHEGASAEQVLKVAAGPHAPCAVPSDANPAACSRPDCEYSIDDLIPYTATKTIRTTTDSPVLLHRSVEPPAAGRAYHSDFDLLVVPSYSLLQQLHSRAPPFLS